MIGRSLWPTRQDPTQLVAGLLPSWHEQAACRSSDPELFFTDDVAAEGGLFLVTEGIIQAKRICVGCPVREQCLVSALRVEDEYGSGRRYGIYGGTMGREREWLADHPDRVEILTRAVDQQLQVGTVRDDPPWPIGIVA